MSMPLCILQCDMTMVHTSDQPYGEQLIRYFTRELPNILQPSKKDLLEILTEILIGTKETRYGSVPPPEHLVVIRDVVRKSIEANEPIPVLVPFGGIKANKTGEIDVAEFSAMRRLLSLDECISRYHGPGITANVRIEDINALWLYGQGSRKLIQNYSDNLKTLIQIIRGHSRIFPIKESFLMKESDYTEWAERVKGPMLTYLLNTDGHPNSFGKGTAFDILKELGWNGIVPQEQRDFYIDRYQRLYPGKARHEYIEMMATYFAGSKARYDLKGNAAPRADGVEGFIQLNYTQPVPGAPANMFNNTLYYRTIPMSEARTHMPAWRSKGYLKINSQGAIKAKITSFGDTETLSQLQEATVEVADGDHVVSLRADYIIED